MNYSLKKCFKFSDLFCEESGVSKMHLKRLEKKPTGLSFQGRDYVVTKSERMSSGFGRLGHKWVVEVSPELRDF
jgi:hypothetical protein